MQLRLQSILFSVSYAISACKAVILALLQSREFNMIEQQSSGRWTAVDVRHLLGRTGFAIDESRVMELEGLSRIEAVELLLREARQTPLPAVPQWVKDPWINTERRYRDTTPEEFRRMHGMTNGRYSRETADLRRWWLEEMISTPVPLREIMTLFWHGHFASSIGKVLVSQAMYWQNATQRQFALGNFRELLKEMTIDPAMMIYLDLEDSDRKQPNENYARELFELFALGHGQYTQQDIQETARALSGWQLGAEPGTELPQRETDPETNRRFTRDGLIPQLNAQRHDTGSKRLFGATGDLGLDEVVALTAHHPACASFLAGKLIAFFGAVDPNQSVKERMAAAYRSSNGEIAPMLRVLFTSDEFYSPASRESLIKSPVVLFVGACRQLQLDVAITSGVNRYLAGLGQELFNPPNVKGWPGGETWIGAGTLALRYHLADVVLNSQEPPGMEPIGRGRGRPIPLPKDPAARRALLQNLAGGRRGGSDNAESGTMSRRGQPEGPALQIRFDAARLVPEADSLANEELVSRLLNRLLTISVRPELRTAALEVASQHVGNDRVPAIVRLILSSPDYQLV